MIKTKNNIYPTRNGVLVPVEIEILAIQDDFKNNQYIFVIADFITENEQKKYINQRNVKISYAQRDGLKKAITSQMQVTGTESEVNKTILANALLIFVQNDLLADGKVMYNTIANDWEIY